MLNLLYYRRTWLVLFSCLCVSLCFCDALINVLPYYSGKLMVECTVFLKNFFMQVSRISLTEPSFLKTYFFYNIQ